MNLLSRTCRMALVGLLIVGTALTSGCSPESEEPEVTSPSDDHSLTIGFSMATYKEDRWLRDRDIFTAKATEAGFKVIVQNANNNSQKQVEQVQDMIASGIDVLVIAPHDANDAARAVEKAKRAGIPVISYDRLIRNADVDVYVSFDNQKVGELMGEAIKTAVPNGDYIILNGSENDNNSRMFRDGYMSVLSDAIDADRIRVVGETWVADWRREAAYDFVSTTLSKQGSVDAIVAANDSLAWAAIDVLSEKRLIGKVSVVGHDADLAACQRIVEGKQLMTVYKPISRLVDETVTLCKTLADGKRIETVDNIDNGMKPIPYVKIDVLAVTKETMDDTVIKDGFHLKEDVYENVP